MKRIVHKTSLSIAASLILAAIAANPALAGGEKQFADGMAAYKLRNYRAAAAKFQESLDNGNGSAEVYIYMAHSFAACGEKGKALTKYHEAVKVFKGLPAETLAKQCIKQLDPQNKYKNTDAILSIGKPEEKPGVKKENKSTQGIATATGVTNSKDKKEEERPEDVATKPDDPNDKEDQLPEEDHVPFYKAAGDKPMVQGYINGKPFNMLIDTGAYRVVVGQKVLQSLNIKTPDEKPKGYSYGAGGKFYHWTMPLEIKVGKVKRKLMVHVPEHDYHVCLGQPFLRNMIYRMDSSRSTIMFTKNSEKIKHQMAIDAIEIPFHMKEGNLMVDMVVDGHKMEANFDTGAPGIMLAYDKCQEFGLLADKTVGRTFVRGIGGKTGQAGYCTIDTIDLGPMRKSKVIVLIGGSTIIGQDFFGHKHYIIDNEKKVIRFSRR